MTYSDAHLAELLRRQGHQPDFAFTVRKKRGNEESRIQSAVIDWWHHAHAGLGVPECLLFSIPNGGRRDAVTGAILKREGARKGTADLLLAVARRGYHGLFIEMKREGGRVSPEQRAFMLAAIHEGYRAVVRYSFEEARLEIEGYLKGEYQKL